MIRYLKRPMEKINLLAGYLCGTAVLVMGLILFFEVVMRYFFHSPTVWAQEISIYIFIWAMFGGAAYTLKEGKHVRIDLIICHLPGKTRGFLEVITRMIGLLFSLFVTYQAWGMVVAAFKYEKLSATPLRFPQWIPQSALLVGFAFLSLQFLLLLIEVLPPMHKDGEQS